MWCNLWHVKNRLWRRWQLVTVAQELEIQFSEGLCSLEIRHVIIWYLFPDRCTLTIWCRIYLFTALNIQILWSHTSFATFYEFGVRPKLEPTYIILFNWHTVTYFIGFSWSRNCISWKNKGTIQIEHSLSFCSLICLTIFLSAKIFASSLD